MTRRLAVAGLITGISGIVASQAVVWLLRVDNPPVQAVAGLVRDKTPGNLAHKLIKLVSHADKPLLITGTAVILLALCAWAATFTDRRPLVPQVTYLVLAAIGLIAVNRLDDSTTGSSFAVVVGLVVWLGVHHLLTRPLLAGDPVDGHVAGDVVEQVVGQGETRRVFVYRSAGVLAAAAIGGGLARWRSEGRRRVERARSLLRLPGSAGTVPTGADLGSGMAPWRSENADFYRIDTAFSPPSISPTDWSLRVHGLVEKELELSYSDLVARKWVEGWVTLCCVSNEVGGDLIGNAWWSGVPIREILAEAGPKAGADAVLQTSADGWNCGTPLAALTDPNRNAMLALEMNGEPLPIEHGFPVRMVVPGLYGYVSATKWVVDLEVTNFSEFDAYWTQRGWSAKGPVKTQSRIDVPRNGDDVGSGALRIGGSAWAQHTGIAKVEFQLDGGAWTEATLGTVPDADTWVQWQGDVRVDRGRHRLVVRATDTTGYTQTSVRTDVIPDGATGWHTVEFNAG